jgi:hypothetical protein
MDIFRPVRIPKVKGKIFFRKYKGYKYVQYVNGRRYDKRRKLAQTERINIGIQIPAWPEYMVPNENYWRFFPGGGQEDMDEKEKQELSQVEYERDQAYMIRDFFEQLYYEFQFQSRRQPNTMLNGYKVRKMNEILAPLKEMMKDEPAAAWLELIPEPVEEEVEGGGTVMRGMTYSDVMMVLTQYRCLEGEFFQKMLLA